MYFPSQKDRERWRKLATKSKMPFHRWIYEMVETRLAEESEPAQEISSQRASLQDENRHLRKDLQKSEARLSDLETEIFKIRHQLFMMKTPKGKGKFDAMLLAALRSGGTWQGRVLLEELGVDSNDIDAIEIVTSQLQYLQDLGLVKESAQGWKWIG